ncbi:MAG: nucleoside hydrolase-like domain-containing protein [Verrucomicrobiota bacterium]
MNTRRNIWNALALGMLAVVLNAGGTERLRVMVETDAGGDPDDEQSLVRFLLYGNEWDVEGIIANRPQAREKENRNAERTGLGIVRAMLKAYGECQAKLVQHDARFPTQDFLWQRTVAGYDDTDDGVKLIIAAVDKPDPRPLWFMNWGTDRGAAVSCLQRALDRVQKERGAEGYAKFKSKLRLSSDDKFGEHTWNIEPPFVLWVDTLRPELEKRRWYHRFSALTATAGGFDIERDVRTGHGPLGAMYPTNTTHRQKEGDSMMFIYLIPTGMNEPNEPAWGSWAGRYGPRDNAGAKKYHWANQADTWQGTTHRENSLSRWAVHLQNDFKARMDWCVKDFAGANHAPVVKVKGGRKRAVRAGELVTLDAGESSDPDGQEMQFTWAHYPEAGTYSGPAVALNNATSPRASLTVPKGVSPGTVHLILTVTDKGEPALTRYARIILDVQNARSP